MTQSERHPRVPTLLAGMATPDVYAQKLDLARDACLAIEFGQEAYRAASFLDDRILGSATRGAWLPLDDVTAAASRLTGLRPLHFIFHTGHVGSTLLSRLLDETGRVLSLREPLPLRTLADAHDVVQRTESLLSPERFDGLLAAQLRLWSRGYTATECVVLKATSNTARLAPLLLANPETKAVYLNQRAESAIATLLAGANSALDLRAHGPARLLRLSERLGRAMPPLYRLSRGEMAAMNWLTESLCRHDVIARYPAQVLAVDFDDFLSDVSGSMRGVLAQFALPAEENALQALAKSPVLARYSKAPEHAYGPTLRKQLLDQARREQQSEITKGLDWLAGIARDTDDVAAVMR